MGRGIQGGAPCGHFTGVTPSCRKITAGAAHSRHGAEHRRFRRRRMPPCHAAASQSTPTGQLAPKSAEPPSAATAAAAPSQAVRRERAVHVAAPPAPPRLPSTVLPLTVDLWLSLLTSGAKMVGDNLEAAGTAAATGASKLQRYMQPPPPGFPPGPPGDASLGLVSGPLEFLRDTRRRYGGVAGMLLGGERVVVVSDPAAARQVLIDQPAVFIKEGTAFFPGSSLTGNGLLVSDGEVWRRQRRLSNPAFRRVAVERYADEMCAAAQELVEVTWQAGATSGAPAGAATPDRYASMSRSDVGEPAGHPQTATSSSSSGVAGNGTSRAADPSGGAAGNSRGGRPAGGSTTPPVSLVRDVYEDFNSLTLNITLAALFGVRSAAGAGLGPSTADSTAAAGGGSGAVSEVDAAAIVACVERALAHFAARGAGPGMLVPEWLPTSDNIEMGRAVTRLDATVYAIISRRRAELAAAAAARAGGDSGSGGAGGGAAHGDLLQALLESVDEEGRGMSDTALRDELMTLLVAGQETSAILLGWACALLAHHPAAQAAAAEEVARALAGRPPGAGAVGRLPYLEAVVLEALRLYSPAYMVGRCACSAVELRTGGGASYRLPAGTTLLVSPYLMHRDPAVWSAPESFQPERWLPGGDALGAGAAARSGGGSGSGGGYASVLSGMGPNGAYVPFGAGQRNCIGTGFAWMEAVIVLANVLQRFELAPAVAGAPFPRPAPLLTLRPESVRLRLTQKAPLPAL